MKGTDGNHDMVWPQVGFPKHRRSACRAEMRPDLSPLLPVADIDLGGSFGANVLPLEIGTNAEHRAGPPLTLATMADAYNIRIGGYFDAQGTARAMGGSRHDTFSDPGAARLQKGGYQNDRLLSIVLLAPKSLTGGFRGTTRRYGSGFAKQVSGDVENGEASTALRERLNVRLDEDLDGLFAGVDLNSNGVVAKVDLVASPVPSSNDGVGHGGLCCHPSVRGLICSGLL